MVKVEVISTVSRLYEMQVRAVCSGLRHSCETIDGARNSFNYDLKHMERKSTGAPSDFYKTEDISNGFEVWHLNALGDKDRLVATITND